MMTDAPQQSSKVTFSGVANSPAGAAIIAAVVTAIAGFSYSMWVGPHERRANMHAADFQEFQQASSEFTSIVGEMGLSVNDQATAGNFDRVDVSIPRDSLFKNMIRQEEALDAISRWARPPVTNAIVTYRDSLAHLHDVIAEMNQHQDMKEVAETAGKAVLQQRAIEGALSAEFE
jgi:hypothetical protein